MSKPDPRLGGKFPPNQDTEVDEADKILARGIETAFVRGCNAVELHGLTNTDESLKWALEIEVPKAKSALDAHYKSILLEVIGADESVSENSSFAAESIEPSTRNKVRQIQRQRLESRLGK